MRLPLALPRLREDEGAARRAPRSMGCSGAILKTYREYRASGDPAWLSEMWPPSQRALGLIWEAYDSERPA